MTSLLSRDSGTSPGRRGRRPSRPGLAALAVLPAAALVALLVLYPVVRSAVLSATAVEQGTGAFEWIASNTVYFEIIGRTFAVALSTVVVSALLGYPYAYAMTFSGPRVRVLLLVVALLPFWISGLVRIFAWVILLQPGGVVPALLGYPDGLLGTSLGVQIGLVQVLLPFMILPLFNGMRKIDPNLVKAAESLGARPAAAFARVFLPLSVPGLYAGVIAVFVLSLGFYVLPQMLGSPQQSMIGEVIYTQVSSLGNSGRAGALALILIVMALVFVGICTLLMRLVVRGEGRR